MAPDLPPPLSDLFQPKYLSATFTKLLEISWKVASKNESSGVQSSRTGNGRQAKSCLWFVMRAGRIAVSKLDAVYVVSPVSLYLLGY